jgi:hypothetical protein
VDKSLKVLCEDDVSKAHDLISACVGIDSAVEFEAFCKVFDSLPNVDDILKGCCREYPKTQDVLYALSASLITTVSSNRMQIGVNELDNLCSYASKFPTDFALAFFHDINHIPGIKEKLVRCEALNAWLVKNKGYL